MTTSFTSGKEWKNNNNKPVGDMVRADRKTDRQTRRLIIRVA